MMALRNVRGFDGVKRPARGLRQQAGGEGQHDLLGADAEIAEVGARSEQNAKREDLEQARIGEYGGPRLELRAECVHRVVPLDSLNARADFSCRGSVSLPRLWGEG